MRKKITLKLIMVTLLMTIFVSTMAACTDENNTDANVTTPTTTENVVDATEETTTKEEETTKHRYKGKKWVIENNMVELFDNLTVENGFKFYVNEYIISENDQDWRRGSLADNFIWLTDMDNREELYQYLQDNYSHYGESGYFIPESDNFYIEYTGDKKFVFEFVEEDEYGRAHFDVHEIE